MGLTPTPEQEAAVLRALSWAGTPGMTASMVAEACSRGPGKPYDGRTVRAWLYSMAAEGKVRRVSVRPERWSLTT